MRLWDSSAIVPLVIDEGTSRAMREEYAHDPELLVWWATGVECMSALARLEREGRLAPADTVSALERLAALEAAWREIRPAERVRVAARRLLRTHSLRAGDALQLAAAIVAADDDPHSVPIVTLDERLALAAQREGFPVVVPG